MRCKLETFKRVAPPIQGGTNAVSNGNRLHLQYSYSNMSFDRVILRRKLKKYKVFSKTIETDDIKVTVRGNYDDLRVIRVGDSKFTSLIELKTTSKKYLWSNEVKSAIRQLQLYMWVMKDILAELGYPLWKRGYVEVYSQKSGECIRRIPVHYDDQIEQWILYVVGAFRGQNKVRIPPHKFCKLCPINVRSVCPWNAIMIGVDYERKRKDIKYI